MTAGEREGMRNPTFCIKRAEIFFNFPSHMWEENFFFSISHPACEKKRVFFSISLSAWKKKTIFYLWKTGKIAYFVGYGKRFFQFPFPHVGRDFFQFPFLHVGREEIFFPFSFPTTTLSKLVEKKLIKRLKKYY